MSVHCKCSILRSITQTTDFSPDMQAVCMHVTSDWQVACLTMLQDVCHTLACKAASSDGESSS